MNSMNRKKDSKVSIFIDPWVSVTEYYFPDFSLTEFLTNVGGTLGFWLGVGIMQLGGHVTFVIVKIAEKINKS